MLNETFYLDGVDARSVGIHLQNPIEFSDPVPICEAESIPGRNGDLIFDTGSYENREGEAECFAIEVDKVEQQIRVVNRFLLLKKGYRRLETSDDLEHFWLARVVNGARIEQRLKTLAPFEIEFDCKPQRFVKAGEETIEMTAAGSLYNQYGFDALPMIAVYGEGNGTLTVGSRTVELLEIGTKMYLDSDTQNAYNDDGINQNNNINAPLFPVLVDGDNAISWTGGITKIEIIPRWWEL